MTTRLRWWSPPLPLILTLQMTGLGRRPSHQHRRRAPVLVCVLCTVVVGVVCVVRKWAFNSLRKSESRIARGLACISCSPSSPDLHAFDHTHTH